MRKSMKQKVALFLSVAMAVTSVDSSVLVAAADVTEIVSEAEQQEETSVEEAEIQQEEVAVEEAEVQQEDVAVEEAEVQQEDETLATEETEVSDEEAPVYTDDAMLEKEQITVKLASGKTAKITVTVAAPVPTGMNNVPTAKKLAKGKTFVLKPALLPAGARAKITYKSSNMKVATVDARGKITAKGKGTAQITITAGKVKKTCKVTVK